MSLATEAAEKFTKARAEMLDAELRQDWETALNLCVAIEGYIKSGVDQERDGHSMTARDIETHRKYLETKVSGGRGIVTNRIEYRRPTLCTRDQ